MAFQLGALNTPRTELVKQDPYKSGNYSNLFSQMNANKTALGQRQDRAKMNKLGDTRADAILDSQGGSQTIQDLKAKQQEALANKDIALYDDLTAQLQSQMQVEAQEARVDPLGKTQMSRDKFQFKQDSRGGYESPVIEDAVRKQTNSKRNALNILDEYFALEERPTKEDSNVFRDRYMKEWDDQKEAMAVLSRYSDSSSHNFQKLDEWSKAIAGGAKDRSAEKLTEMELKLKAQNIEKLVDEGKLTRARANNIYAEQNRAKEKHSLEMDVKRGAELRKDLADLDLAKPEYYEGLKSQAIVSANAKNPFILAKLLSQIIEKGLAVNEGEVRGLMGADDSAIRKWVDQLTGAPEDKIIKLQTLIGELADNRIKASSDAISKSKYKPQSSDVIKKTEPTKALTFDPATGKFN